MTEVDGQRVVLSPGARIRILLSTFCGAALAVCINFATADHAKPWWWGATLVLAVASGFLAVSTFKDASGKSSGATRAATADSGSGVSRALYRASATVVAAVVLILALTGSVIAVIVGGSYLITLIPSLPSAPGTTGTASSPSGGPSTPPVERLVKPASATLKGLTITVDGISESEGVTRVTIDAVNRKKPFGGDTLGLHNQECQLTSADGTVVKCDPFNKEWPESLPLGQRVRGTLVLEGTLPASAASASLTFNTIFEWEGGGAMTVGNIPLKH